MFNKSFNFWYKFIQEREAIEKEYKTKLYNKDSEIIQLQTKLELLSGGKKTISNPEKQRKIRIENALENKYIDDDADNENKKRNKSHKRKFISFIDSKLINNLMKHFTGKVKNEISTQLINREIDGNHDDDFVVKEKHKVVHFFAPFHILFLLFQAGIHIFLKNYSIIFLNPW